MSKAPQLEQRSGSHLARPNCDCSQPIFCVWQQQNETVSAQLPRRQSGPLLPMSRFHWPLLLVRLRVAATVCVWLGNKPSVTVTFIKPHKKKTQQLWILSLSPSPCNTYEQNNAFQSCFWNTAWALWLHFFSSSWLLACVDAHKSKTNPAILQICSWAARITVILQFESVCLPCETLKDKKTLTIHLNAYASRLQYVWQPSLGMEKWSTY